MKRLIVLATVGVISLAVIHVLLALAVPASRGPGEKEIAVPKGASFAEITRRLKEAGIVRETVVLQTVARWKKLDGRIRHGTYAFPAGFSGLDVLEHLRRGRIVEEKITIPEGFTSFQIAALLEEKKFFPRQDFLQAVHDPAVVKEMSLPVDFPSLEGVLFPDTYSIPKGANVPEVIQMLVNRYRRVWADFRGRAEKEGFSERDVVTLASIIEKETGKDEERTLVSSVFRNRLSKKIALQSDPTVIYALLRRGAFDGNLTRQDLRVDSPYNTYRYPGLPAGPIANPGRKSFEAALAPAETAYLYFVSRNDGTHHFSGTLREHNRAVERYQVRGGG